MIGNQHRIYIDFQLNRIYYPTSYHIKIHKEQKHANYYRGTFECISLSFKYLKIVIEMYSVYQMKQQE